MKFRVLVGSLLVWGSLPGWAMPGCSMPDCSMSDCSMSGCSMSGCSKLGRTMSGCSMSGCSKLGRTMSGCSMSGRTMLGRTMSGWGTLALSGARSSCASGPSLEHLKKIEESPSFEHSKKIEESPSLEHLKKIEESPSSQERKGDRKADAEQLARALDYFASEKFHESLVLLQPLNRRYKLNPRYRAYLAVCLYYEWEYAEAIRLFDEVLPLLQGLAPHELSLYYWMDAESYFALQQYDRALPLYGKMLPLCRDNEKPDAYYRLGFCHLFAAEASGASSSEKVSGSSESSGASEKASGSSEKASGSSESSGSSAEERKKAKECFELSLEGYLKYRNTPNEQARIAQIRHMIGGLK
jgi:tetratricopeptide (TPR) repeat protein